MINLDTHILIFSIPGQLLPAETDLLQRESWSVSPIVFSGEPSNTRRCFRCAPGSGFKPTPAKFCNTPIQA